MRNFQKLSRTEMKNVLGGKPQYTQTQNVHFICATVNGQPACDVSCAVTCDVEVSYHGETPTYYGQGACLEYSVC